MVKKAATKNVNTKPKPKKLVVQDTPALKMPKLKKPERCCGCGVIEGSTEEVLN